MKITIDEDGTNTPPILPLGTITRKIIGTDRTTYHLARLDRPATHLYRETGDDWTLLDLVVAPKFQGGNLTRLLEIPYETFIPVGIARPLCPVAPDEPILDFSKVSYFAVGRIYRIHE